MRSFFGNKRLVLLLAVLSLGALTVLAISLNNIPFREAEHFASEQAEKAAAPPPPLPPVEFEVPLWKQLVVAGLFVVLVVLISLLLSPKWRKRLLWLLLRAAIWVAAIFFLWWRFGRTLLELLWGVNQLGKQNAALDPGATVPIPAFEPPQVSPVLSYLLSFLFALIFLLVVWLLYRGWERYLRLNTKKSLEEIAFIARSSLDDLSAGRNSSDVIINCYLRMSDVVAQKRRLRRAEAMTPHEFALHLEQAGLPGDAVARLTRLFEAVRYGDRKSGPRDVREAVSCLETILQYCGEPV
jgi:hypothetical protein